MRSSIVCAVLFTFVAANAAMGGVVADYQSDFTTSGAAKPGWSYLWNKNGPIGTAANYVPLVRDAYPLGFYETEANGTYPDSTPGVLLAATPLSLIPGQGSAENSVERYAIAAYTVSAADIATNGNQASLDNYTFGVAAGSLDGITAAIYVNNTPIIALPLPPGIVYDRSFPDAYAVPLGNLNVGDTIYVAIGGGGTSVGDQLVIDYSIILVPEPAAFSMVAVGACALLARRRRQG